MSDTLLSADDAAAVEAREKVSSSAVAQARLESDVDEEEFQEGAEIAAQQCEAELVGVPMLELVEIEDEPTEVDLLEEQPPFKDATDALRFRAAARIAAFMRGSVDDMSQQSADLAADYKSLKPHEQHKFLRSQFKTTRSQSDTAAQEVLCYHHSLTFGIGLADCVCVCVVQTQRAYERSNPGRCGESDTVAILACTVDGQRIVVNSVRT